MHLMAQEAQAALRALDTLAQRRVAFATALKIRAAVRELNERLQDVEAERMKLIEQYAVRDGDGQPVRTNVSADGSQWQYELTDRVAFEAAFMELMQTEFEINATFRPNELERVGDVEPAVLIGLGPLLVEDEHEHEDVS